MVDIRDIATLEGVLGSTPPAMHLKVIDHLDAGALQWIANAPLAIASYRDGSGIRASLVGGVPGFASGDAGELRLSASCFDGPEPASGSPCGMLFLIPGVQETLRVNGRVAAVTDGVARIAIEECYGHCAKAFIRSEFWNSMPSAVPGDDAGAFVGATRFLALATIGSDGRADLSPKGDPAGLMAQLDGDTLWFADRPGNRRIDSFRNIVEQPEVALLLIAPGSNEVVEVRGRAGLSTDPLVRERFTVRDRVPAVAVRVDIAAMERRESPCLRLVAPWPAAARPDIDAPKLFMGHMRLNKAAGLMPAIARAATKLPGAANLLKRGLEKDYSDNLY